MFLLPFKLRFIISLLQVECLEREKEKKRIRSTYFHDRQGSKSFFELVGPWNFRNIDTVTWRQWLLYWRSPCSTCRQSSAGDWGRPATGPEPSGTSGSTAASGACAPAMEFSAPAQTVTVSTARVQLYFPAVFYNKGVGFSPLGVLFLPS